MCICVVVCVCVCVNNLLIFFFFFFFFSLSFSLSLSLFFLFFQNSQQLVDDVTSSDMPEMMSSGDYRPGFCYVETTSIVAPGEYTIVVSTWEPNQVGPFFLYVETSLNNSSFKMYKIPSEGHGKRKLSLRSSWSHAAGTAVGCANHGRYESNPKHRLILTKAGKEIVFGFCFCC